MNIHQFHSGVAAGDAITNQMLYIKKILKKMGYFSEIYAEHIPRELDGEIKSIVSYHGNKDNVLLVHHSMGFDCFDKILALPDKKVLIYHNITPERFFDDAGIIKYVRLGLEQLEKYREHVDYVVADSNYNRQQLIRRGYSCDIDVMPVQVSLSRFENTEEDVEIVRTNSQTKNFIFVGRLVANKCQHDVIKAFTVYHRYYDQNSKLFLIGDTGMQGYVNELRQLAEQLEVAEAVVIPGKVTEEELKAYYKIADFFVCMSEHEGFGVPLLEAMKMGVPVVAYRSSAIPETMDGAGIIVTEKNYAYIGTLFHELLKDTEIYEAVVQDQYERIRRLEHTDTERILNRVIKHVEQGGRQRQIQMQGPFESSYSLAIVNRKLIEALDELSEYDASIYCTEGPGDYEPDEKELRDKPRARELWQKSVDVTHPDITIRNMYPPRVHDVNGGLNFQSFGWEESVIPHNYIEAFNTHLSGIGTTSDYVTEKLIECGLTIPVKTMGNGVELVDNYEQLPPYPIKTKKNIKFLHISSAFPRKGVDVLLRGYFESFTGADDVCLILKTFPNPHNTVGDLMEELNARYENPPEVEWINEDLSQDRVCGLYKCADCYVQTARGEGFGLPVAEAMLARIPVIVCPNSGMADFCTEETALLVDYILEPAKTHLTEKTTTQISMWAEPVLESLVQQFRYFMDEFGAEEKNTMVERAFELISTRFTWQAVAGRWQEFIGEVEKMQYRPRVDMVTTWNNKCGIAEYTKMEIEASAHLIDYRVYPNYGVDLIKRDEDFVEKRLWHSVFEGDMKNLCHQLIGSDSQIVHFQFNFGFFKLHELAETIRKLADKKKVIITFHKTADSEIGGKTVSLREIAEDLNRCSALVVHQQRDAEQLQEFGVHGHLIQMLPLGQIIYPEMSSKFAKTRQNTAHDLVVSSYGFFLPHKGVRETIQAVAILKEKYPSILYRPVCALHESRESEEYYSECLDEVKRLGLDQNVEMVTDFLENDESMRLLQASNVMVMAYHPSMESASGAVRFCLAALRPTITTDQSIFKEFSGCTYQIDESNPGKIADAIEHVLTSQETEKLVVNAKRYIKENSWYETGRKFYTLYKRVLGRE